MSKLGLDYGKKKIGLALATGSLAEVYDVIRYNNKNEALVKIGKVIDNEEISKIVVGISEGKMAKESKDFGKLLGNSFKVEIDYHDEILTTKQAQRLSIEAGIKREKRKRMEDAYAAVLMLQNYLEKPKI